jgi:hypothetical protein
MSSPWLKDGKKVSINGNPVLCNRCPCDEECISRVDSLVLQLTQQGWQVSSTRIANFTCAEWQYSEQTQSYVLVSPAQGELIIALPHATAPDFSSPAIMLVYGVSLYNATLNRWRVVGCQCEVSQIDYTCQRHFIDLLDYDIAGTVPVYSIDESDSETVYTPADSCRGDDCEILKRRITSCQVYAGTLYDEGWFGWVDAPNLTYSYKVFKMAFAYAINGTAYIAWLDCDCTKITVEELPQGSEAHLYLNACQWYDADCPDKFALVAMAQVNGWTLKGEGLLIHKASTQNHSAIGDWFELKAYRTPGMVAAIASDRIYYVSCDCRILMQLLSRYENGTNGAPSGYWDWLEYEGACNCIDIRELWLEYPDRFGVIDVSWGNNTKYVTDIGGTHIVGTRGNDKFLEYRTLCVILKEFDDYGDGEVLDALYVYSPTGSPEAYYNGRLAKYADISFAGHALPFQHDNDLDFDWYGEIREWHTDAMLTMACNAVCYNDEQTARQRANAVTHYSSVCALNTRDSTKHLQLQSPDATENLVCSSTLYKDGDLWCAHGTVYALGNVVTTNNYKEAIVYYENWIQSNRGIIRPDGGQPLQSLVVYGIKGSHGNTGWYNCSNGLPTDDETITATLIDEDMHGCHDFDWQTSESE